MGYRRATGRLESLGTTGGFVRYICHMICHVIWNVNRAFALLS